MCPVRVSAQASSLHHEWLGLVLEEGSPRIFNAEIISPVPACAQADQSNVSVISDQMKGPSPTRSAGDNAVVHHACSGL